MTATAALGGHLAAGQLTAGRLAGPEEPLIRWGWLADHLGLLIGGLVQHLVLTFVAVGVGFVLALALASVALRHRAALAPINAVTGMLYAIPSLALFVVLTPITGLTTLTAEIDLVSYTLQILVRAIVTGIDGVPSAVRQAALGMGCTQRQLRWRVEAPLALPVIVSGLRIATVTTVGLVPIAGLLGSDQGGLGQLIFDGLNRFFPTPLLAGAVLTVALAVGLDVALQVLQRRLTPWTRAGGRGTDDALDTTGPTGPRGLVGAPVSAPTAVGPAASAGTGHEAVGGATGRPGAGSRPSSGGPRTDR